MSGRKQLVWVLQTARAGDNAQVLEIARRLGGKMVVKKVSFNAFHHLPNWLLGAGLGSLVPDARPQFAAPWPDMVIAAGKRTVPVARWIRFASGGRTKLVQVGRPRAALADFDLVISTPQYGLPQLANVIELALPFASPRPVSAQEVSYWTEEWKSLPRPWVMVSMGAGKFPQRLGEPEVRDLGARLSGLDASLIVIASPRTEPDSFAALAEYLGNSTAKLYPWRSSGNPYQAALVLADRIVVTSDSMSMVGEAVNSGKPVSIFRLPVSRLFPSWSAKRGIAVWLSRHGLLQAPRNMPAVVDALIAQGYAAALGDAPGEPKKPSPGYQIAIDRIRALSTHGG